MDLTETVQSIADRSRAAIPIAPIDYYEGGLLYCGTCRQPKETVVTVGGQDIIARCLCRCGMEARKDAEAEALRSIQEQRRAEWLRGFDGMTFAKDNGKNPTMNFARKYADKWDSIYENRLSFTLSGGVGCGKTYAAAAIANEILSRGYRVWMVTAPALVDMMGFDDILTTMNRLRSFDLVVIDDLGAERGTDYAIQKIFEAVDARAKSGLPTIITTNLNLEADTGDLAYDRIVSRIKGFAPQFRCKGEDLRVETGKEKRNLVKEMLNG